jgi:hypothetical protein
MFRPRGSNELGWSFGFVSQRRQLGVVFGIMVQATISLKPSQMIKCCLGLPQKGVSSLKGLGQLKVIPLRLQGPNPKRGLALRQLGLS